MHVHYFQHVPFEGPAFIETYFSDRGAAQSKTLFFLEGSPLPKLEDVDFLVIMGGPMSVNDEKEFPWLVQEKAFIRDFITAGKPVLGICLGAQLVANSQGAKVYANPQKEIGWFPIQPEIGDNPALFPFSDGEQVFHWHGETFDLPMGAVRTASSEGCANQAFQLKANVIGLQFHAEMGPQPVADILQACGEELVLGKHIQSEAEIVEKTVRFHGSANHLMARILAFLTK